MGEQPIGYFETQTESSDRDQGQVQNQGNVISEKRVELSQNDLKRLLREERLEEGEAKRVRNAAARDAESMTEEMKNEVISLLNAFGLPYVIAPYEAEAQCAGTFF